jgi:hypothetical protein
MFQLLLTGLAGFAVGFVVKLFFDTQKIPCKQNELTKTSQVLQHLADKFPAGKKQIKG